LSQTVATAAETARSAAAALQIRDELLVTRDELIAKREREIEELIDTNRTLQKQAELISRTSATTAGNAAKLNQELQLIKTELAETNEEFNTSIEEIADLVQLQNEDTAEFRWQRDLLLASTSWRTTAIFRTAAFSAIYRPVCDAWYRLTGKTPRQLLIKRTTDFAVPKAIRAWREKAKDRPPRQAVSHHFRVLFVSGEYGTPGHVYRIERMAAAARLVGANVTCL
jgi:hypothetical protein